MQHLQHFGHTGQRWFSQANQHSNKWKTTLDRHYLDEASPRGPKQTPHQDQPHI